MKLHPAANAFPLIEGPEFDQLVASIRDNGFDPQFPVIRWRGQTLDGRNRERAAKIAEVAPKYRDLPDDADPWMFAWRANGVRRHLPADQKAAIYISILKGSGEFGRRKKEKETEKRAGVRGDAGGRGKKKTLPSSDGKVSRSPALSAEIGSEIGVSGATVERVLRLEREAPEAFEAVKKGETTAGKAASALRPKEKRREPKPSRAALPQEPASSPRLSSFLPDGVDMLEPLDEPPPVDDLADADDDEDLAVTTLRGQADDVLRAFYRRFPHRMGDMISMIRKWLSLYEQKASEHEQRTHSSWS